MIEAGRLAIAIPEDVDMLEKAANGLYIGEYGYAGEEAGDYVVRQGQVERSNVNMAREMSDMMASQRSLQSCSQIVKMYDEMAEQMNTRIARV